MRAASEGRLDIIKESVAFNNINVIDWRGCALPAAIKNGHVDIVKFLLERGANTGVAINVASTVGSVEMVQILLNHGASVGDIDYESKTPLHCACEWGHIDVVKELLANGAKVNEKDMSGRTPLHHASRNGKMEVVAVLVSKGAKINSKDRSGNNALHRACVGGNTEVVKKLLKHKASIHAWNYNNMIPLHCACELGNTEVVEVLTACGKYSKSELNKALLIATEEGFHDIVAILLKNGASVCNDENPLYFACLNGRLQVVKVLLEHGADIQERNNQDGSTPLHIACNEGHLDIVESLLEHGADVFVRDDASRIPIHYARSGGVVRALLQRDVDVNTTDLRGNTALIYASEHSTELCCTLLDYGAGAGLKCRKLGCLREKTGMMCYYMFCRNNIKCHCRPTGKQCFDCSSHKNICVVDSFEKYFIKLTVANIVINENEKAVDPPVNRIDWSQSERDAYATLCRTELEKLKALNIKNTNITYFDLLFQTLFDLQDEAILGNFDVHACVEEFPIYGDIIHTKYLGFRKAYLSEHCRTFFGLTEPWLPIECADRIIRYLSNRELDILVKICHT